MEKIAQLQGRLNLLTEENRKLKEGQNGSLYDKLDLDSATTHSTDSISCAGKSVGTNRSGERDKLKEALRALKRVTVKQEVSLSTLRQKSKQRRTEIEEQNVIIKELQQENEAYRQAHERMKTNNSDDVSQLRSTIADLELKLAKEESLKEEQSKRLEEREAGISNLQARLANLSGRREVKRNNSSGSHGVLSVMSDSTSGEDVARLKKELARKSEKITNLQHELEMCRDEVFDLKQRNQFSKAFPKTPAAGELDFFDDDTDDDDVWEAF